MTMLHSRAVLPSRRALRVTERVLLIYRRQWWLMAIRLVEPVLYMVGIGVGVGALVGSVTFNGHQIPYVAFVAPALMASAAMNGALDETMGELFFSLRISKSHQITLTTPVRVIDLAAGEILSALLRGVIFSSSFLVVMWLMGGVRSVWGILTIPAAVFIGFSFACVGCAVTTYLRNHADLDAAGFVMLPLFLFSATFYPTTVYPGPLRIVAELSPLTRSADLMRSLTTGTLGWSIALDVAYLLAIAGIGFVIAARRLERQLLD
jgi:lipooligosaccharide transport system permease protein